MKRFAVTPTNSSDAWIEFGGHAESRYAALDTETGRVSVNQYLVYDQAEKFVSRLNSKEAFIISKGL